MTKTRFRVLCYFFAAYLGTLALSADNAHDAHAWVVANIKAGAEAWLVLRAFADQTNSQDGKEAEPTISK